MIPRWFFSMVREETRLVFRRPSGTGALVLALVVGVGTVVVLHWVKTQGAQAQVNGLPLDSIVNATGRTAAAWALRARNFFVLPMMLLLASAASLGGELGDHTLREVLVRPVSRVSILLAKLVALSLLSLATLLLTLVPALGIGVALYGSEAGIDKVLLGYAASWLSDLGLLSMGLMVASFLRSVGGVVVSVVMFLMVDLAVRAAMALAGAVGLQAATTLKSMLPGDALAAWEGYQDGFLLPPFLGLAGLFLVCMGVAVARLQRADVP